MYARIRKHFSPAAMTLSVIAIVLALTGAAFAASGALSGKQKKEVEKIAKKYAGKPGAVGANGTNGTNGKDGNTGAPGKDGTNGDPGAPGTDGKSPTVVGTPGPGEEGCLAGGTVYEAEGVASSEAVICNGEEGSPWTAGGTLPPGSTETGAWIVSGSGIQGASLTLPIPLATGLEDAHIHINEPLSTNCPGLSKSPKAAPGEFCVYIGNVNGNGVDPFVTTLNNGTGVPPEENLLSPAGGFLYWQLGEEPTPGELIPASVTGSFAVTACSEAPGAQFPCPTE